MRHLLACCACAACIVLAFVALDAAAARSRAPGQVWMLTRGAAGPAMAAILQETPGGVVAAWGGARLLVLQVESLAAVQAPPGHAWLVLRLPAAVAPLAACG